MLSILRYLNPQHRYNLYLVKQNGYALRYIEEQTPEICVEAVKQTGDALHYVKEQTPEICLEAIKKETDALQYVKEQTTELCLIAVKRNGLALKYVKEQTPEICLEAVKDNGCALQFVKELTPKICLEAIKRTIEHINACNECQIYQEYFIERLNAYKYVNPFMRNSLSLITLSTICISLKQLQLPSYVLMDIIDTVLWQNTVTHYIKINKVIQLNETKK